MPELYWYECAQDGRVKTADADGRDTTSDKWPDDCDKDQLYAGFVAFCGERRVRHVPTKSWFYRQLLPHGVEARYRRGSSGDTERLVEFPGLEDMRAHWNQTIGARGEKL
jgi:hypothetical protein